MQQHVDTTINTLVRQINTDSTGGSTHLGTTMHFDQQHWREEESPQGNWRL